MRIENLFVDRKMGIVSEAIARETLFIAGPTVMCFVSSQERGAI